MLFPIFFQELKSDNLDYYSSLNHIQNLADNFIYDSKAEKENKLVIFLVCFYFICKTTICFRVPGVYPDTLNTVRIRVKTNKLCFEDDKFWSNWSPAMSIGKRTRFH